MFALSVLRRYWDNVAAEIEGIAQAVPLTLEATMADKVRAVGEADSPVIFWLVPSAEGRGDIDAVNDENLCVVFVMKRYNPRTSSSFEALELTQPAAEALRRRILDDARRPCHFLHAVASTVTIIPETEFFGNWAGWSIAFSAKDF